MLDNIPITVLTTTYNCGPYIAASIKSILNQTYKNFELLIIDDGSTDNTDKIVTSIDSKTIRNIRLDHIGRSAALNFGLKEARYDWVALMDADDIASPDRLEKEIILINLKNNNIIFSDSVYFRDGKIQFLNSINTEKEDLKKKIEYRGHICNSSVLYNRRFILDNGGYNEKLEHSEDHELWIRLLEKGNFIHLNDWLIFMRIRENSLSKKVNEIPVTQIPVFNGSDNPMTEKKINNLKSIREYFYRRKFKLRVKYFGWKFLNYKTHIRLTKKIQELDQPGDHRVLHLQIELNKTCGVTRYISRLIKNSHNYEHHVIALGGDATERFQSFNYKIIDADRNSLIGTVKIFSLILNYIKKNKINIVHSHHRYFDLMTFLLKSFVPIKTVTTVHSKVYNKKTISYKSDKVIVVSNAIKQHLINNFNVDPSDIILMNNFVDQNEVKITQKKEEVFSVIGINPMNRLIGYFGRLDIKEKGVDILLDAVKKIAARIPSVYLILAGNGIDEKILKESALNSNLPVLFLGNIDNIWDYLNVCEIVILPSRVEPFNLVMIEAGLLSKPVVGANVDGIADTLIDQVNGILFAKENVNDLANKIIELLSDKIKMESLGRNLKDKVVNEYTTEKVIPRIEEIYNLLLVQ